MAKTQFKPALWSVIAFFLAGMWLILRPPSTVPPPDILLHAVLSMVLAVLLLLKAPNRNSQNPNGRIALSSAVVGLLLFATGKVLTVNQIQWLGIIGIVFGCLRAGLANKATADIAKVTFMLYWANPLPSAIFLPLQVFMQKASVAGSELLLQAANVRVWADGLILRTGIQDYEIPAWCSGMRTATAVLILTLGIGMHARLKAARLITFTLFSLTQALILNIVRITLVVFLAPYSPDPSGFQLLHDSSGVILMAAVLLVALELQLWKTYQARFLTTDAQSQRFFSRAFSSFPATWNMLRAHRAAIAISLLGLLFLAGFGYRCRPYHRSEMIKTVAGALRDTGQLEAAYRAAEQAFLLQPDDQEWNLARIRILLLSGKYQRTLAELEQGFSAYFAPKSYSTDSVALEVAILRAYSLIGLQRYDDASAIIKALPDNAKRGNPLVAMVLAEIGFHLDDVDQVASNIVAAAEWEPNYRRIRSLYPYLRKNRRWREIVKSDHFVTHHTRPIEAFCAMEAAMNIDDTPRLAVIIENAIRLWPQDPRLIEPLYFMVLRRGDAQWEERFAAHFRRCLAGTPSPDNLLSMIKKAFEIHRADLAWSAYNQLTCRYPDHPGTHMVPGYYGERWFHMDRSTAGTKGVGLAPYTDLRPYILMGMSSPSLRRYTSQIPLRARILDLHTEATRISNIRSARKAFKTSKDEYTISMKFEYARMLEMTASRLELESFLNSLARSESNKDKVVSLISEVNERKGNWIQVYDGLREYDISPRCSLPTALRLCRAQINLRLYLAAQNTAAKISRAFPESSLAAGVLAETELLLDRPEEALRVLRKPRAWRDPALAILEARALFRSGRAKSGIDFCAASLIPVPDEFASTKDSPIAMPAETALLWHKLSIPSKRSLNAYSSRMLLELDTRSPFLAKLYDCWLDAYKSKAAASDLIIEKWSSAGDDVQEKATSLSLLTLLACSFDKQKVALDAATKAAMLMPKSPLLWYPVISLSRGDPEIISQAARHCPEDTDIWLAQIVTFVEADRDVSNLVHEAVSTRHISPAGITRAASYLSRMGLLQHATALAESASDIDPKYLPAQLTALRCALRTNNRELATKVTRRAIQASTEPDLSLYLKYVELNKDNPNPDDRDLLNALKVLRREQPDNPRWPPMLAYLRFRRGGWEDIKAYQDFRKAMDMGVTNRSVRLFAAEASRRIGNPGRGAQILRNMLLNDPDDVEVLNNLAYTLASTPRNPLHADPEKPSELSEISDDSSFISRTDALDEALRIVPRLMNLAHGNLAVLDTCTFVAIEAGKLQDAGKILALLSKEAKGNVKYTFKSAIHQARLQLADGKSDEAEITLKKVLDQTKVISDEDIVAANQLLAEILSAQEEKHREFFEELKREPLP